MIFKINNINKKYLIYVKQLFNKKNQPAEFTRSV